MASKLLVWFEKNIDELNKRLRELSLKTVYQKKMSSYYDAEGKINEYDLTLFIPEKDGLYRKFAETHYQRNYAVETLQEMLHKAGFTAIAIYDDYTDAPLCQTSERAVFVAKKSR